MSLPLLTLNSPKTEKGEAKGYLTGIMYLSPSKMSGFNVCPMASRGCALACLNTAGRGIYKRTQDARLRRTLMFFNDRPAFMAQLVEDVYAVIRKGKRMGLTPVFRLNGTSDIRWENEPVTVYGREYPNIMTAFPHHQFYDYTKIPNRRNLPKNYHLTFSLNEANEDTAKTMLQNGVNVAVVFRTGTFPRRWWDAPVVSGDKHDLRFLDPKGGRVIALKAKGKARHDKSGFVKDLAA